MGMKARLRGKEKRRADKCRPNTPANNPWLAPEGSATAALRFTSQKFRRMARPEVL